MMKFTPLFFLLLFFCACGNQHVPKGVIPPNKMDKLLWDLVRVDELNNIRSITDTSSHKLTARVSLYQQVFDLYHVRKEDFQKSIAYYQTHPDLLKIVLDSVYNRATAAQRLPRKDSLK